MYLCWGRSQNEVKSRSNFGQSTIDLYTTTTMDLLVEKVLHSGIASYIILKQFLGSFWSLRFLKEFVHELQVNFIGKMRKYEM